MKNDEYDRGSRVIIVIWESFGVVCLLAAAFGDGIPCCIWVGVTGLPAGVNDVADCGDKAVGPSEFDGSRGSFSGLFAMYTNPWGW